MDIIWNQKKKKNTNLLCKWNQTCTHNEISCPGSWQVSEELMAKTKLWPDFKLACPSKSSKTFVETVGYSLQIQFIYLQTRKGDTHNPKIHLKCGKDMKALQSSLKYQCARHWWGFVLRDPTNGPNACLIEWDMKKASNFIAQIEQSSHLTILTS